MGRNKKRKHAQFVLDSSSDTGTTNKFGVAATLAQLQLPDLPAFNLTSTNRGSESDKNGQKSEDWQTVDRRSKKQQIASSEKLEELKYPQLTFASHRLQASIKISDLQALVLYTLADGISPQWISVRQHRRIRKVVVVMVPGLEKGMFDGRIFIDEGTQDGEVESSESNACTGVNESIKHSITSGLKGTQVQNVQSTEISPTSPDDYLPMPLLLDQLPGPLKPIAKMFPHIWPIKSPGDDRHHRVHSPVHAMLTAPLPKSKEEVQEEKTTKGPTKTRAGKYWEDKRTPITTFIASPEELLENEYVLHPVLYHTEEEKQQELLRREQSYETADHGWADSKIGSLGGCEVPDKDIEKGSLTAGREIFSMDCEMCKTEGGGLDLTRVSLIGWDGDVVLDELVKPDKPIIDYLTPCVSQTSQTLFKTSANLLKRYSGITAVKLEPVTTTLGDVQSRILGLLHSRSILIGHSLNSDLNALRLTHPFIVDTSIIYQHPRGPPLKSSLKWLSQKYIGREIQKGHGSQGHDSIEDARACLDLVKQKCERGSTWGTSEAVGESIFKRLARSSTAASNGSTGIDGKTGAIIDWGNPERGFGALARVCIACENDERVVEGVRKAVNGDDDGELVPGGGVDFTWARLRELELLRAWSNGEGITASANQDTTPTSTKIENPSPAGLTAAVSRTVSHLAAIYAALPPCTLFVVYSGTGDPREMARLQAMQQKFKKEFQTKKWDQLSVKWTDVEEQALKKACKEARKGCGFVTIK